MEKLNILSLTVILVSAYVSYTNGEPNDNCRKSPTGVCQMKLLSQFAVFPNLVPDEQFLKQNCNNVIAELQCLINYEKECDFLEDFFYPFRSAYALRIIARELCNENSMLRKSYLEHINCLNSHTADIRQVALAASDEVQNFWRHQTNETSIDYTLDVDKALGCIFMSLLESSETAYISWLCGEETKNMAWNFYYYIVKPREMLCSENDKTYQKYSRRFEKYHSMKSSASSLSFFLSFSISALCILFQGTFKAMGN